MRPRSLLAGVAVLAALAFAGGASAQTIKVGVTAGPHAEIMEVVKQEAAKSGLTIQIVEFSDYIQPNAALSAGDLDANSYQHQPYLDNQVKDRGYKFVSVGKTVLYPIGLYSKKIKTLADLKSGATVALPNDPTNGSRVLLLLQREKILTLKNGGSLTSSPIDVTDNPKKLKLLELDAAQLPRSLDDVDLAGVNTNFAITAGLDPVKDAIVREDPDSPYANVIAVRTVDKDKPAVAALVKAYHTDAVRQFILTKYKNAVIPAF